MQPTLNVAIIGLGNIGLQYDLHLEEHYVYSHARAFALHPAFTLQAGIDPCAEKRQQFSSIYSCQSFETIDIAFQHIQADVVVIASPTSLHLQHLEKILEVSCPSYILIEKPLGYEPLKAERLLEHCRQKGVQVYVNYLRTSEPGTIQLKKQIKTQRFEKGVLWYCKGLFNGASHFINLLQHWFGEAQEVQQPQFLRWWTPEEPEADFKLSFLHLEHVLEVQVLATKAEHFFHNQIELIGPLGRITYLQGGEKIFYQRVEQDPILREYNKLSDEKAIPTDFDRIQWHVADHLYNKHLGQSASLCTGSQALKTLKLMNQIKENFQ